MSHLAIFSARFILTNLHLDSPTYSTLQILVRDHASSLRTFLFQLTIYLAITIYSLFFTKVLIPLIMGYKIKNYLLYFKNSISPCQGLCPSQNFLFNFIIVIACE